jgi:hypothetical protein
MRMSIGRLSRIPWSTAGENSLPGYAVCRGCLSRIVDNDADGRLESFHKR